MITQMRHPWTKAKAGYHTPSSAEGCGAFPYFVGTVVSPQALC